MRYLLAFLFPPLAVLLCGKPFQAIASILFTAFFWMPGVIHALIVIAEVKADKRTDRIVRSNQRGRHDRKR
jgi:uncharacterized membrane protein YqaE (UPF0057 family)